MFEDFFPEPTMAAEPYDPMIPLVDPEKGDADLMADEYSGYGYTSKHANDYIVSS